MKLSILLPTRNRLELLRDAIETVRRQEGGDWEIVVSDNASEDDVAGYVSSLGDERIVAHRTDRLLPVTENWNAALARSSGDYVLMLGDDDGLLPGYVANLELLVARFDPDVVYTSALRLTGPGVVPGQPDGALHPYGYAAFMAGTEEPFLLEREVAHEMVRAAMDFRLTYGYNAQFLAVSRRLIDELAAHGPFYQSRFPDYYSTNVAFLKARRIVVDPTPRVVIGVSPKSYGFYHQNKREDEGRAFLDGHDPRLDEELERILLPGSNINVGWLSAVEAIAREYGAEFGLRANRGRFRRLQAAHVYEEHFMRASASVSAEQLAELEARLGPVERRLYRAATIAARGGARVLPARLRRAADYVYRRSLGQFPTWDPPPLPGRHASVLDVFEDCPNPAGAVADTGRLALLKTRAIIISQLLRRRDSKFVSSYLKGLKGIEIGASSHNNYFLDALNVDRWAATDTPYKQEERMLALHVAKVDVVAGGDDLPFADGSLDFVFSSHVLEHFPDPIRALLEWQRVARRYVVAVVPHRDRTFDRDRPLTTVDELLERHRTGFNSDEDRHWSVWTCESFLELCERLGLKVVAHLDPDDKVANGFIVVIDAAVPAAAVV